MPTPSTPSPEAASIHSNGSKWYGEQPDSLATLLDVLSREPLDPRFEKYGNFASTDQAAHPGLVRVHGNFLNVAHVFSIDGTPEQVAPLIAAIRKNQKRADYREARAEMKAADRERAKKWGAR